MCGIFGHTGFDPRRLDHSRAALQTLAHRGPDQWGDWHDGDVYLGHRRLSILDLSEAGRQPMHAAGDEVLLTANGEVYNFAPLRARLEPDHVFTSGSDSEVLLHGYRAWGIEGLVERIEGMYAFAIYDRMRRKVFLVRDRVGIKPLYYSLLGGRVAWASELKALQFLHQDEALSIDWTAVYDYLTYSYVPAPKSMYAGIFKLPPAHVAEIDVATGALRAYRYWSLSTNETHLSVLAAASRLRALVREAVGQQMVSDVPVGFFLSGGMDSSAVVAEAASAGHAATTFSIGFDDPSHDETGFAALVAESFGTEHIRQVLSARATTELFPLLREWFDEPFADTSAFPTRLVSCVARERCKVVLTGDGGDELFGGYRRYQSYRLLNRFSAGWLRGLQPRITALYGRLRPSRMATVVGLIERAVFLDEMERYARLMRGLLRSEKETLRQAWELPADYDDYWVYRKWWRPDLSLLKRLQYVDFHTYLPDRILTKVDRTSMSVALECRVPLLATPVVEFAFSLPEQVLYAGGAMKGLMKIAYRNTLPEAILKRRKKGFSVPRQRWRREITGQARTTQENILQALFPEVLHSGPLGNSGRASS